MGGSLLGVGLGLGLGLFNWGLVSFWVWFLLCLLFDPAWYRLAAAGPFGLKVLSVVFSNHSCAHFFVFGPFVSA